MKKIFILILTVAYLTSTSGATIYLHQCMGKMIEWNLKENEKDKCGNCGMHKNAANDCCKDHVKVLKVQNDQNLPEVFFNKIFFTTATLPVTSFSLPQFLDNSHRNKFPLSYTHLRSCTTNYCVLYCTFLI